MRPLALFFIVSAFFHHAARSADKQNPEISAVSDADLDKWVAQLSSADEKQREKAAQALLAAGDSSIPKLMKARDRAAAPAKAAIINVLGKLIGETVSGISVALSVDKPHLKLGETARVNLTFFNTTDKDINFLWGWNSSNFGAYTEPWDWLRIVDGEGKQRKISGRNYIGWWELCGTFNGPIFRTIQSHSGARARCECAYRDWYIKRDMIGNAKDDVKVDNYLNMTIGKNSILAFGEPGVYRIMFYLKCTDDLVKNEMKVVNGRDDQAPFWTGVIYSNEIEITLDPPPAKK